MPERGRSELKFRAGATDVRVTSRNAHRRKWSAARTANARASYNSGRDVIDYDVDESVVTDLIRDLAERIPAARQRIA